MRLFKNLKKCLRGARKMGGRKMKRNLTVTLMVIGLMLFSLQLAGAERWDTDYTEVVIPDTSSPSMSSSTAAFTPTTYPPETYDSAFYPPRAAEPIAPNLMSEAANIKFLEVAPPVMEDVGISNPSKDDLKRNLEFGYGEGDKGKIATADMNILPEGILEGVLMTKKLITGNPGALEKTYPGTYK